MVTSLMPRTRSKPGAEFQETPPSAGARTTGSTILVRDLSGPKSADQGAFQADILWHYVVGFLVLHAHAVYGLYLVLFGHVQTKTIMCALVTYSCSNLGIMAGSHRLWAHRAYTARLPLRIVLAAFQTMAFQYSIYKWARDHRVHHKYTDTDADPHNASRGFFFSHAGWLMVRRHPDVHAKGGKIDMKDLEADPVVMWQKKYYLWLVPFVTFLIPSSIPYWFWNEPFWYSFAVAGILRYTLALHATFLVNSVAHIWGTRPYDKNITPTENSAVAALAFGEGWHNYHHAFPRDYKAAELGDYRLNFSTAFIDACALLGLAYDLKTVDPGTVAKRLRRTGDGTKDSGDGTEDPGDGIKDPGDGTEYPSDGTEDPSDGTEDPGDRRHDRSHPENPGVEDASTKNCPDGSPKTQCGHRERGRVHPEI